MESNLNHNEHIYISKEAQEMNDNFKTWLESIVEETNNSADYISMTELASKLTTSIFWAFLPKKCKRNGAKFWLKKKLREYSDYTRCFRRAKVITKRTKKYDGYLICYRFKQ